MAAVYCCVLIIIFLNSFICLLSKAAKSIAPALLFLLELSPWIFPGLLASALLVSGLLVSVLLASDLPASGLLAVKSLYETDYK